MARKQARSILAYSLHGRTKDGVVDYLAYFQALYRAPAPSRQTSVGDQLIAVSQMSSVGSTWLMRFVSGDANTAPMFFDPRTGEETTAELSGQILASAVWMMVDPTSRYVAIERKRPGVPVSVIAQALSHFSAELNLADSRSVFDLNPIPAPSFVTELERFERIRQASVVVARPNYDWTDNATRLTEYAAASDGQTAETSISAGRGESLSKTTGIIEDIRRLASRAIGPIKNLRVTGRREGEQKETSVSLARHQERAFYNPPTDESLSEQRAAFADAAQSLLSTLPPLDDGVDE